MAFTPEPFGHNGAGSAGDLCTLRLLPSSSGMRKYAVHENSPMLARSIGVPNAIASSLQIFFAIFRAVKLGVWPLHESIR